MSSIREAIERRRASPTPPPNLSACLERNHDRDDGVWLVTHWASVSDKHLTTEQVLDELLRFCWMDGRRKKLDDGRTMQYISPKRTPYWSKTYEDRIARLTHEGRMHPADLALVDALIVPADLAAAFAEKPPAQENYDAFPPAPNATCCVGSSSPKPKKPVSNTSLKRPNGLPVTKRLPARGDPRPARTLPQAIHASAAGMTNQIRSSPTRPTNVEQGATTAASSLMCQTSILRKRHVVLRYRRRQHGYTRPNAFRSQRAARVPRTEFRGTSEKPPGLISIRAKPRQARPRSVRCLRRRVRLVIPAGLLAAFLADERLARGVGIGFATFVAFFVIVVPFLYRNSAVTHFAKLLGPSSIVAGERIELIYDDTAFGHAARSLNQSAPNYHQINVIRSLTGKRRKLASARSHREPAFAEVLKIKRVPHDVIELGDRFDAAIPSYGNVVTQ